MRYVFGDYTLDAERYELRRAGQLVPVEPRVFDLLASLVQHAGHTVLTEELLTQLYPHEFAPVERLTNAVAQARKVLHDTAQTQRYIQTVRRRGYRFRVPVTLQPPGAADFPAPPALAAGGAAGPALDQVPGTGAPPVLPLTPCHTVPCGIHSRRAAGHWPWPAPGGAAPVDGAVCRLVGFPERAEPLDPEELLEVVPDYRAMCAEVVRRFEGHIAQYQGDRLVVYFGYPQAHEDDARRPHTGLGIVEGMARLNRRRERERG